MIGDINTGRNDLDIEGNGLLSFAPIVFLPHTEAVL